MFLTGKILHKLHFRFTGKMKLFTGRFIHSHFYFCAFSACLLSLSRVLHGKISAEHDDQHWNQRCLRWGNVSGKRLIQNELEPCLIGSIWTKIKMITITGGFRIVPTRYIRTSNIRLHNRQLIICHDSIKQRPLYYQSETN